MVEANPVQVSVRRHRKKLWLALCSIIVLAGIWFVFPIIVIASIPWQDNDGEPGEASGKSTQNVLVFCGQISIRPTINAIRTHSAWTRGYAYLPGALGRLGEPAHGALLKAIDDENDPN